MRRVKWSQIEVGDLVLVEKNKRIPADLLLLTSSEPKGEAFIETSTLDGEKHLKPRESLAALRKKIKIHPSEKQTSSDPPEYGIDLDLYFDLKVQHPNPSLYNFEGYIQLKDKIKPHKGEEPSKESTQLDPKPTKHDEGRGAQKVPISPRNAG